MRALKLNDLPKVTQPDYLLNWVVTKPSLVCVIDCFYICKFTLGIIFYLPIKFPKGIFDIHISLVQVEINFLLTCVVSFKISPVYTFAEKVICLINVIGKDI